MRHAHTTGGRLHLTSQVVKENLPEGVKGIDEQKPQNDENEISPEGWKKSKKFQNKVRRLERARHQRDQLMRKLEEVWSFLEDGMPGLETDLEPHSMEEGRSTSRKRKRARSREDEVRRLEEELEEVRASMEELRVELKEEEIASKDSLKIPALRVEISPVKDMITKFEEKLVMKVPSDEVCQIIKLEKSPSLKILIDKYENMRVENESVIALNENYVLNEKCDNTECGPSEADVSSAKPDSGTSSNHLMCVMPVMSNAKPVENGAKLSQTVGKARKRVWGVKKNGLFGWKMVVGDKQPSKNIPTNKKNITQPTSIQKCESNPQQNSVKNWLVMPKSKKGGGGIESDNVEVSTNLENIHSYGFNNPRPDSNYPAKTDQN